MGDGRLCTKIKKTLNMEFKNRKNIEHEIDGRKVWESRSVAVTGVILIFKDEVPYVLVSERGPNAADFQGKMNLVAGYLDWNENGFDALTREAWEETGVDLITMILKHKVLHSNTYQPWAVTTQPGENHQNVTLRYGIAFQLYEGEEFPILTTENNEIEGETINPQWMPVTDINNYEWAFNHNRTINDYTLHLIQHGN